MKLYLAAPLFSEAEHAFNLALAEALSRRPSRRVNGKDWDPKTGEAISDRLELVQ